MRRYHKTENRKPKTENPLPSASAMTLTNDKHTNTQTHHRVQRLLERVDLAQHVADHVPSVVLASYHHSMLTNGLVVERLVILNTLNTTYLWSNQISIMPYNSCYYTHIMPTRTFTCMIFCLMRTYKIFIIINISWTFYNMSRTTHAFIK